MPGTAHPEPAPVTTTSDGNALGAFLRARREAVPPAAVGLPAGPRRRTPGLRRAEVAALAGVSVEYLTRLERGSDRHPSPQVLAALADALRLSADEHVHMLRLVKVEDSATCTAERPRTVRATVRALLDRFSTAPAAVIDPAGDVLAATPEFGDLCPPDAHNLPEFVFLDPRASATLADWDAIADEWATRIRAAAELGHHRARVIAVDLAQRATTGFTARYERAPRVPAWTGTERWVTPDGAVRTWAYEALEIPATEEHRLLVYLPA